mmetsp:Transcript_11862/g.21449  ORF Transcript_11862/g.21449 Transcript_11862/m.21449 type:complete len:226 (-) Transcript_11862:2228-2905(-)
MNAFVSFSAPVPSTSQCVGAVNGFGANVFPISRKVTKSYLAASAVSVVEETRRTKTFIYQEPDILQLPENASDDDVDDLVCTMYRLWFGSAWEALLEADGTVAAAESLLFDGLIDVRSFSALVAKSRTFRVMFFQDKMTSFFVDQLLMRLLGRGLHSQEELTKYALILQAKGYDAVVDAMLGSHEFEKLYGDNTLPLARTLVVSSMPENRQDGSVQSVLEHLYND